MFRNIVTINVEEKKITNNINTYYFVHIIYLIRQKLMTD